MYWGSIISISQPIWFSGSCLYLPFILVPSGMVVPMGPRARDLLRWLVSSPDLANRLLSPESRMTLHALRSSVAIPRSSGSASCEMKSYRLVPNVASMSLVCHASAAGPLVSPMRFCTRWTRASTTFSPMLALPSYLTSVPDASALRSCNPIRPDCIPLPLMLVAWESRSRRSASLVAFTPSSYVSVGLPAARRASCWFAAFSASNRARPPRKDSCNISLVLVMCSPTLMAFSYAMVTSSGSSVSIAFWTIVTISSTTILREESRLSAARFALSVLAGPRISSMRTNLALVNFFFLVFASIFAPWVSAVSVKLWLARAGVRSLSGMAGSLIALYSAATFCCFCLTCFLVRGVLPSSASMVTRFMRYMVRAALMSMAVKSVT